MEHFLEAGESDTHILGFLDSLKVVAEKSRARRGAHCSNKIISATILASLPQHVE
jgi:hypothetical protein